MGAADLIDAPDVHRDAPRRIGVDARDRGIRVNLDSVFAENLFDRFGNVRILAAGQEMVAPPLAKFPRSDTAACPSVEASPACRSAIESKLRMPTTWYGAGPSGVITGPLLTSTFRTPGTLRASGMCLGTKYASNAARSWGGLYSATSFAMHASWR
jgi:hypothetical protein